jgi:hypothetical protein
MFTNTFNLYSSSGKRRHIHMEYPTAINATVVLYANHNYAFTLHYYIPL